MSSTILYRFRSEKVFVTLHIPGSSARLLDIKTAIVQTRKLRKNPIDFDLIVSDAHTGKEYTSENTLISRGSRLVLKRLPAESGHGTLAKISRTGQSDDESLRKNKFSPTPQKSHIQDIYTIDVRDEEDEFESVSRHLPPSSVPSPSPVMPCTSQSVTVSLCSQSSTRPDNSQRSHDEMNDDDRRSQKRTRGLPLSLHQFSGGSSVDENTVPAYLQCAICNKLVRNAMLLPWDKQGRSTCEHCILTAMMQNGSCCPLTNQEDVNPNDLLPNPALRKAAQIYAQKTNISV